MAGALPGDDAEPPDAAEPGGDRLGEAISEILVVWRAAILEGEHCEHFSVRNGQGLGLACGPVPSRDAVPHRADDEHDPEGGRGGAERGRSVQLAPQRCRQRRQQEIRCGMTPLAVLLGGAWQGRAALGFLTQLLHERQHGGIWPGPHLLL